MRNSPGSPIICQAGRLKQWKNDESSSGGYIIDKLPNIEENLPYVRAHISRDTFSRQRRHQKYMLVAHGKLKAPKDFFHKRANSVS